MKNNEINSKKWKISAFHWFNPILCHSRFLDALASLKAMFKIQQLTFSSFCHHRVLHSIVEYYRMLQCTMCCLCSMFSSQPNKLRHILKIMSWYIIQHICPRLFGWKTWFSRKPWFSNSKFGISRSFWPILSVPKIMFLEPENEKRNKF